MARLAFSIRAIEAGCCVNVNPDKKQKAYCVWTWILTFWIYCSYHLSRKPISVVKNVLDQNCTGLVPPPDTNDTNWCKWKPFDTEDAQFYLGMVDSAFLFSYAIGMFFSGMVAERMDLRLFLSFGMVLSGAFCAMFGLGYTFSIHVLWFYIVAQACAGLVQCSGWPGVMETLANWFSKNNRGVIFGIWNSHTSVGNILGTLIAATFVTQHWSLSFLVPGLVVGCMGVVTFFFLVPSPEMVGLPNPNHSQPVQFLASQVVAADQVMDEEETSALLTDESGSVVGDKKEQSAEEPKPISFIGALKIPGVLDFSLCLFFAKLVSYTFLYWLPNFILFNTKYDAEQSAQLSVFFDVGGIAGGVLAGFVSDRTGMSATTCVAMLLLAIPMMFVYQASSNASLGMNIFLLLLVGLLVNGPYALITTAVSADLGTHESLAGNSKALATVTAIIDGTGSVGAAVGPLIAGAISEVGWQYVFYMLMAADMCAMLLLIRVVVHEVQRKVGAWRGSPVVSLDAEQL